MSPSGCGHTPDGTELLWPCPEQGQVRCPSGIEEPARHNSLLWPQLHRAKRLEEMFELLEQETSIYACSPASKISSAAGLLCDFVTSAEKQSRAKKTTEEKHTCTSLVLVSPANKQKSFKDSSHAGNTPGRIRNKRCILQLIPGMPHWSPELQDCCHSPRGCGIPQPAHPRQREEVGERFP